MSIYFQYPTIDEYPNFIYPIKKELNDRLNPEDEDSLSAQQILELKDYLTFKQL